MVQDKDNGKPKYDSNHVLNIEFHPRDDNIHERDFDQGRIRSSLLKIMAQNSDYFFYNTVANPQAVKGLEGYVVMRNPEGRSLPEGPIRELLPNENPRSFSSGDNKRWLRFGPELVRSYNSILAQLASERFGKDHYAQFPIVEISGADYMPEETRFWPTIHVVRDLKEAENFLGLVEGLTGEIAQSKIRKAEAPQNYHLPEFEQIQKLGIPPLITLGLPMILTSKQLASALNFLTPFTYSEELIQRSIDDD